jgi:hypothetical protein
VPTAGKVLGQRSSARAHTMIRYVYADLPHGFLRARVYLVRGVYARAIDLEAVAGEVAQKPFGHLASRRVLGVQEQHLLLPLLYPPPFTSSACTRSLIRSLTERKTANCSSSDPLARDGPLKDQCSLLAAPGKNGHASLASSQTVIT